MVHFGIQSRRTPSIKDLPCAIRKATKSGIIDFSGHNGLTHLPDRFSTPLSLDMCGCENLSELPSDLTVGGWLDASGSALEVTPRNLNVGRDIILRGCYALHAVNHTVTALGSLDFTGCEKLANISGLQGVSGNLEMTGCISLLSLPERLRIGCSLNLSDCRKLSRLPSGLSVSRSIRMRGCEALEMLPDDLMIDGDLDLTDCIALKRLPASLHVTGLILLSGCNGIAIPEKLLSSMRGKIFLPQSFSVF